MLTYYLDTVNGQLLYSDTNESNLKQILLLTENEYVNSNIDIPKKNNFSKSLKIIKYCKLEKFPFCLQGTMKVPSQEDKKKLLFAFCLTENALVLVKKEGDLKGALDAIGDSLYENISLPMFLLVLLKYFIRNDFIYLQTQEEKLVQLQEMLMTKMPKNVNETLMRYHRKLLYYHEYYQQLIHISEVMLDSMNKELDDEEEMAWQRYANQAERYHDNVEMLQDYLIQIRDLYQSKISETQNRVMSFLTIVTTVFFPLTLIAGWYGMNFTNMPELEWEFGYPCVLIISALIIVVEVIYFKKKKML